MTFRDAIFGIWAVFWIYWLISAFSAKASTGRRRAVGLPVFLGAFLLLRVVHGESLAIQSSVLKGVGLAVVLLGLGLAVWARVYLGRNWGMPMTQRAEPELVTSGPYRFVRHPIYSGILLATLGTALAVNLFWLVALASIGAYFVYSARVEERNMVESFPEAYPSYRAHTKMLIPFVL